MKKTKLLLGLCALSLLGKTQPFTGITHYDHSGINVNLSSGNLTRVNSSGFLMGSYIPSSIAANNYNLFVDKTDQSGLITSTTSDFEMMYQVFAGNPCTATPTQLLNCYGVSLIESQTASVTHKYILAASFNEGCVISALDMTGNVVASPSCFIPFPTGTIRPSKPLILESLINPNHFYVVGAYTDNSAGIRHLYALLINSGGSLIWEQVYDLGISTSLEPKAIVESPFSPSPELVIAGIANPNITGLGLEGFLLYLDGSPITSGGTPIGPGLQLIGSTTNSNEEFHSIYPVTGTSNNYYVIGGYTNINTVMGTPWMLQIDPVSSFINWSSQLLPSSAFDGEVVGVLYRNSPAQYYGTVRSSAGSVVLKLDVNGLPFSTAPNEFLYNPSYPLISEPVAISHINTVGDINEGIHVYGTDDATGPGKTSLTQSFFNGTSGTCSDAPPFIYQFTTSIANRITGPNTFNAAPTLNMLSNILGNCPNHSISGAINAANPIQLCPFTGNPPGPYAGSNARPAVTTGIPQQNLNTGQISIQPNPVQETLTIRYALSSQQPVKIEIFNALGQRVKAFDQPSQAGENQMNIDFSTLGVESGIYFIHTSIGQNTDKQKVIYQK
jgi:hypothetical protein